jgi:hypothetical protein
MNTEHTDKKPISVYPRLSVSQSYFTGTMSSGVSYPGLLTSVETA